jgi:hypothetical protein
MSELHHPGLHIERLLDGGIEPGDLAAWPRSAREHLRVCPACQAELDAERQLRAALLSLTQSESRHQAAGPPSPAERQARLRARRPVPVDALILGHEPLPRLTLRSGERPLELQRTSQGVRAWHPDATELMLLAAGPDRVPVLLRHTRDSSPGVGAEVGFMPDDGADVFAVAARDPLVSEHWITWLADALHAGDLDMLLGGDPSDFVHLARTHIPAPLRGARLRVRSEPLPLAGPDVAPVLQEAMLAGQADRLDQAAQLYGQALEAAFSLADASGQVRAATGLALAFRGLGYGVDAERVMRWLVDTHELDAEFAVRICCNAAMDALYSMDPDSAEQWVQEAASHAGDDLDWVRWIWLLIARVRGDHPQVAELAVALEAVELPPQSAYGLELMHIAARARQGHVAEAGRCLEALEVPPGATLEVKLVRAGVEVDLAEAQRRAMDWPALAEATRWDVAEHDGGLLAQWDQAHLVRLADRARRARHHAAAAALLRLRFLDSVRAADPTVQLLALASIPDGLLLLRPGPTPQLTRLGHSRARFEQLAAQARNELRGPGAGEATRLLGSLIFGDQPPPAGEVVVGSDGLLAPVPLLALARAVLPPGSPMPAFRELVGLRRAPIPRAGLWGDEIVSMADALGDLPCAASELRQAEARRWLRGKEVTRASLRLCEPCGLLHLGLHARREQGVPQLLFADGPMGPVEIARLRLEGAPVVLLAGCATGVADTAEGVERSLADAFLRAGASAVIATRWPVEDAEIQGFVRALVRAWPFDEPAVAVTRACLDLARTGAPARCWAAPVVY